MNRYPGAALGCAVCAVALAIAAVLPYRAMAVQDAARLSAVHPLPSADVPTGLSEKAAQSDTAQALYARMRMLGEANTNYGDYGLGTPAEFDDAALSGAADALWEAGVLPQVFFLVAVRRFSFRIRRHHAGHHCCGRIRLYLHVAWGADSHLHPIGRCGCIAYRFHA